MIVTPLTGFKIGMGANHPEMPFFPGYQRKIKSVGITEYSGKGFANEKRSKQ